MLSTRQQMDGQNELQMTGDRWLDDNEEQVEVGVA